VSKQGAIAALPKATHGAADHPLRIGDIEIPCYVLEDETRVLSLRGLTVESGFQQAATLLAAARQESSLFFETCRLKDCKSVS
jgi:hypothetical protein